MKKKNYDFVDRQNRLEKAEKNEAHWSRVSVMDNE